MSDETNRPIIVDTNSTFKEMGVQPSKYDGLWVVLAALWPLAMGLLVYLVVYK